MPLPPMAEKCIIMKLPIVVRTGISSSGKITKPFYDGSFARSAESRINSIII